MRVDVNVSVESPEGKHSERVEVKNVAGAKNVERAVEYEFFRHMEMMERGEVPFTETRRYDAEMGETFSIRDKEDDPDYRFFLDPDLPAIHISEERKQKIVVSELPFEAKHRFCKEYGLEVG